MSNKTRISHLLATAATLLATAVPAFAQGRTTTLTGPAALGARCYLRHQMPTYTLPHFGGFLWSAPYAGTSSVPGFTVNGLLRVDPVNNVLLGTGVANGDSPLTLTLSVPNAASLVGYQLDCQSFDFDSTNTFWLASNDVSLTVVAGPSPALNMVPIAPGTFTMGQLGVAEPLHQVVLTSPFWMSKYEVTLAQWLAVVGLFIPSFFGNAPNAMQRPVEQVSWNSAVYYCQLLTASEQAAGRVPAGYQYRLPTEAEWEYCCRAGTTTEWHTGTSLGFSQANFGASLANSTYAGGQTSVVGSYAPNAFGLHDMHGNVAEWCLDTYAGYASGVATNPVVTGGTLRMFRGGAWTAWCTAPLCRSSLRWQNTPDYQDSGIGFRVVLAPIVAP